MPQSKTLRMRLHFAATLILCLFAFSDACYSVQSPINKSSGLASKQQNGPTNYKRPQLSVPFIVYPPKIDGILDDACWKSATSVQNFYRMTSPVTQQTEVWVCADTKRMYVAFHCIDSQPNLIRSTETQRNQNTYSDDFVQIDIDSEDTKVGQSTFTVTERGTQNESLEGGTADNITWAGDWYASTKRTSDGWSAEFSIPFALLRYPQDAHEFGVQFERKLARENSSTYWPDRPPQSQIRPIPYYGLLADISPGFYKSQPIFLPYALLGAGQDYKSKLGLDIKYPLNTGLTSVATINPDFATIEQSVADIAFSYSAQTINDRRPFFAEGSNFFPSGNVLYTPNIGNIDEGIKVTGKEGSSSIGALATNLEGSNYQRTSVVNFSQDLNTLSSYTLAYAGNYQAGEAKGDVGLVSARYGVYHGRDIISTFAQHIGSWQGNQQTGSIDSFRLNYLSHSGHPAVSYTYTSDAPNFISELGSVPFVNFRGYTAFVSQGNNFDKGTLESYQWRVLSSVQNNINGGGVFRTNDQATLYLLNRGGTGVFFLAQQGRHLQYHDHRDEIEFDWSNNSSNGGGSIDYQAGSISGQNQRVTYFSQNYALTPKLILDLNLTRQLLGTTTTSQLILTPTYKLTSERTIAAQMVNQYGSTDLFLVYSQQVRQGSDIYLIFGNPNSATTQDIVQLKIVTPF